MTIKTVIEPSGADCGFMDQEWGVEFILAKKSVSGGQIIQKLILTHNIKDCFGKPAVVTIDKKFPFWEAFEVPKGSGTTGEGMDDSWNFGTDGKCSTGTVTIAGETCFYEGLTLPEGFKATGNPPTYAIPTTEKQPKLPLGTDCVTRKLTLQWNCCPCEHKESTKVSYSP